MRLENANLLIIIALCCSKQFAMCIALCIYVRSEQNVSRASPGIAGYRFQAMIQSSFTVENSPTGWWVTPYHFGIDQGLVVLMIENYRTGLLWDIVRRGKPMAGLLRAGFRDGWLDFSKRERSFVILINRVTAF